MNDMLTYNSEQLKNWGRCNQEQFFCEVLLQETVNSKKRGGIEGKVSSLVA